GGLPVVLRHAQLGDRRAVCRPPGPLLALLRRSPGDKTDARADAGGGTTRRSRGGSMIARAVHFHGPGRPLEIVTLPVPEPRGEELLVRVSRCTLCRSDLHTHAGRRTELTPCVLGHEIVGRIEAFGPGTRRCDAAGTAVSVGDRATGAIAVGCGRCFFCAEALPQKCERPYKYGHQRATAERPFGGGLADFVVLVPGTAWF